MAYRALSEQEAVQYVKELPGLFEAGAVLSSREIGDGNLNLVFHIRDEATGKSVIVKQALPYARVVGESWPLTLDRARIESEALRIQYKYVPDLVPQVYHYDQELALTVMEDLSDHILMRKGLIEGRRYPNFAKQIGRFMAHTLFFTSDLGAHPYEKKALVGTFLNPELCKITEDLVFTDPYENAPTNSFNPLIRREVEEIWKNKPLKLEIAKLKYDFLTRAEALLHGDLHTGSIFVTETSTKVIDPEFAYYGPIGFDIGAVIANLLLNYAGQHGLEKDGGKRESYREYLLTTVEDVWNEFVSQFVQLWHKQAKERSAHVEGLWQSYVKRLIQDTAGFAGCKILRRVIGLAGVADLNSISDEKTRAEAERLALLIGQELILKRGGIEDSTDITDIVRNATTRFDQEAAAV
ncbi:MULTISPECIES: S-methyl-5-thioribose kinase [Brevibacillus]|jgi:5-methylthioribose kinase|uniref:S-methyl-5-thioribose kinase n=1 Tax=Brevibacillus TaxID=55080 RepID=UPI0004F2B4B7|nr:S-methyl-5-thioribose kinase [Brevibacillus borstelensis]KKX56977.1 methylthioribose kinase [Brevibacillus borstelensis cifa_chp40]MBE5395319.1 S-methyl-5-thioribose kinase [Brevibacillus borstelensis]MCC0566364.1 S-methyl-5-thioribose kinase [Brevibacillus borstelensis]MCM3558310.1 S-methyl-5-thioribose kinase [Brevibacillus borstelensis]MCM3590992.1 S-methyl-5-thioribose kinase [Brevibacillus borstelensis]